eukprot:scaffold10625_cov38-Phaeocystis_antarctica.AAC.2
MAVRAGLPHSPNPNPNLNPSPSPNPSPNPNPNPNQVMAVTAGRDVHAAVDAIRASDAREISP